MKQQCTECGKDLSKDEIALFRKLIDKKAKAFQCIECLSATLGCTVEDLETKIEEFKEQGCSLFI